MKKSLEVEVQTATQCSFIPFTPVPDGWAGQKAIIAVVEDGVRAESDYARGFREGYERRHMEVLGAVA